MGVVHIGLKMSGDELWRKVESIARATLARAAFGRSGARFYEGGSAVFEDGGGIIIRNSGYIIIDGDITGAGEFDWTGPWKLSGPGQVTAPTTEWSGDIELTGDLNVVDAGRIKVGSSLVLNPSGNNGRVEFANGAQVFTDGSSIQVYLGNGVCQVSNAEAKLQVGGTSFRVQSGQIYASGMDTMNATEVPGGFVGAIVNFSGQIFRLV
ncbi:MULTISPECIES: hypothetical protein [unclassified Microbacterium]|uniref:hypothetical protein n=1 Tax=unclassified Microbacterium TaxID=2609290 RepID=UPI0016055AF5|nr:MULTISPECIES: hypothetical protein [unclassified Microbacterium]QNA93268.1 hypothetical protein G4G29_14785 [Microbacterium sp. Se63.02b]QYM63477.1 hypothetical protein K1X59_14835 [Microbacterium sp. Se5.02b]